MGCGSSVASGTSEHRAQLNAPRPKKKDDSHRHVQSSSRAKPHPPHRHSGGGDDNNVKRIAGSNPLDSCNTNDKNIASPVDLDFNTNTPSELNSSRSCTMSQSSNIAVAPKHMTEYSLRTKDSRNNLQQSVNLSDTCSISTGSSAPSTSATVSFNEALQVVLAELKNPNISKLTISTSEMQHLQNISSAMKTITSSVQETRHTMQNSWKSIEQRGLLEPFAHKMYDDMLSSSPHLRVFFYGINLEAQSRALIKMLCSAVYIYESPQSMVTILTQSGARHRGYGVTGEMFTEMKTAFMNTFPLFVDRDVFEATKREWIKFWDLAISLLQYGNITPEGDKYGKMYDEQNLNKLQQDMALIKKRQSSLNKRHSFSDVMLYKAAEMISDFAQFERAKKSPVVLKLFEVISHVVERFDDKEYTEAYLHNFGAEHVSESLPIKDLNEFSESFLYACRYFAESEWNVATELHFMALFKYTVDHIYAGFSKTNSMQRASRASRDISQDYEVNRWDETLSSSSDDEGGGSATFCMLLISVESSDQLWSNNPQTMRSAMHTYHKILRRLMNMTNAYEVKKIGDSCALATRNVYCAVQLALALQLELMRVHSIAPGFTMLDCTEGGGEAAAWNKNSLRVRISIEHCTENSMTYNLVHNHYDYYFSSIERCMRVESVACGGQILMSRRTYDALLSTPEYRAAPCPTYLRGLRDGESEMTNCNDGIEKFVSVTDLGQFTIRGLSDPLHLISMVPSCLSGRVFYANEQRRK